MRICLYAREGLCNEGGLLCRMKNCTINILGTKYSISFQNDEDVCAEMNVAVGDCGGYCDSYAKEIVIANLNKCSGKRTAKDELQKSNLRHEIIHAFLHESGLRDNTNGYDCWAKNEEMVDWFAIQFPKIHKIFEELNLL